MKIINVNISLTEEEHAQLTEIKKGLTWREYLIRDIQ